MEGYLLKDAEENRKMATHAFTQTRQRTLEPEDSSDVTMSQIRPTGIKSPIYEQTPKSAPVSAGRQTFPTSGALGPQTWTHPDSLRDDSLSSTSDVTRLLGGDNMASIPLNGDTYYTVSAPCSLRVVNIITFHAQFSHELYRFFMYRLLKHFLRSEMDTLRSFFDWIWPIDTQHRPLQPVQEPMGLETPRICLGHLFSEAIYGNDVDIPLYYFNIVQGRDNTAKVVITTSKTGAAGAAYYQAVCGSSTVSIFAICQRALRRCREADSILFRRALTVTEANAFLDKDPVGGTVLSAILKTKDPWAKDLKISALVRNEAQAAKIKGLGVTPEVCSSFDELDKLESIGEQFDIIIHAGSGWHTPSAKALIKGQGTRRQKTGTRVHYIQISGTSNLSDRPYTEGYIDNHVFSDEEDIFSYEKYRESREVYFQRTTDIAVVEDGEAFGVTTYIIMAPTIFGLGSGPFNRFSMQLPTLITDALQTGGCSVVSRGDTVYNHVHIEDLAALYLILLRNICANVTIPSGRKGIYFCESGQHSHFEFSERLAQAGHELGVFSSSEVAKITIQEAGEKWLFGSTAGAELGFASNSRIKAVLARKLGWAPSYAGEWENTFRTELTEFIKNPPVGREMPKIPEKIDL
ncbi:hypothetical protein APSETT444_005558 [Aspergillus pseudonomiae]